MIHFMRRHDLPVQVVAFLYVFAATGYRYARGTYSGKHSVRVGALWIFENKMHNILKPQ